MSVAVKRNGETSLGKENASGIEPGRSEAGSGVGSTKELPGLFGNDL